MSENHIKMPTSQRAKQFAPFDAVVGLKAALLEREKIRLPRKVITDDLSEEINRTLNEVKSGDTVTLLCYNPSEQNYVQITGRVKKTDIKNRELQIESLTVKFDDIYEMRVTSQV